MHVTAAARAETTLTVAMTAGDIPITTGIPDQGSEGVRFVGYSLYDALVLFDLSHADQAANIRPGPGDVLEDRSARPEALAVHLARRREMARRLPVHRRGRGVELQAHHRTRPSPQFDPLQFALGRTYAGNVASVEKVDDHTVAINMDRRALACFRTCCRRSC